MPGAIVPWADATAPCTKHPCPWCKLQLPHNVSDQDVCARIKTLTMDASAQVMNVMEGYLEKVQAAEEIMWSLESYTPSTAAPNLWTFTDSRLVRKYNELMHLIVQRVEQGQSSSEEFHEGGSAAAAAAPSGSRGTGRDTKRSREDVEYPQWQFKSGKKKSQWKAYDKESNDLLEAAWRQGFIAIDFCIEKWKYTVNFQRKVQISHEHGTQRDVRRLEDSMSVDT